MRRRCALLCWIALAVRALAEEPAGPPRLETPELVSLCRSPDVVARRYCLATLVVRGDPAGDARRTIAEMASRDPELREEARDVYARLYGAPPPDVPPLPQTAATWDRTKAAGDPMRVILAPTAFTRPQGTSSFNAFELGTLTFDHGISPNVALGLQTAIPLGGFVFGPTLRVGVPFEGGAVGVHVQALGFSTFTGRGFLLVGGGPMLTLGNYDRYFNIGALAYFVSDEGTGIVIPHAGFSLRVSRAVRFGAEAYVPGVISRHSSDSGFGKLALILWGFRLFGESVWGDIALADPVCDGCGSLYRTLPMGFPFLNLGVGW